MTVTNAAPAHRGLVRAVDRCDRCGAEALVRVVITKTNLPLLFCGHHYAEMSAALRSAAHITHDERAQIKPAS